ncbi:SDR family oxidoreductase [Granulicatella sp. WM01]|uniref:SDR family NAD(P)-dependent oxidoreductase n=1 Tax=Granulicatella sp. WM01 TaxID=2558277 RepID=UPI00142FD55F|nr:SDR family oxidoreductase [Granulicatella sp. WM01]
MKTVVITGASGGLGEALVEQFAKEHTRLILVARQEEKLMHLCQKWCHSCKEITYLLCDLASSKARVELLEKLKQEKIDVFIHNAGYGYYFDAHQFHYADVENMMQVNLIAPIHLTNALLPKFYTQQSGHIIFVASQAGKMTTQKSSLYSATKFGLRGYANGIRLEAHDKHVYVTCVNPGPIATNFFKTADKTGRYVKAIGKYMLHPQDVAKRIYKSVGTPKREINMPYVMEIMAKCYVLFPKLGDYLTRSLFNKK